MVKKENLDVWPLSNWELVSHFFIFRPIADEEMILEKYAEDYSNQYTTGKSPFQLVQFTTVLNNKKLSNNRYVSQHMIPFPNKQKLITC